MANVTGGTVVWNLDVDSSKFDRGIDRAKSSVDSAAGNITKSLNNIKGGERLG